MESEPNQPGLIDLSKVEGAFSFEEGFHRPDWQLIGKMIQQGAVESVEENLNWKEAARQWLRKLQSDLGGDYGLHESKEFLLLTELGNEDSRRILDFAERTLAQICERLGDVTLDWGYGKSVILLFSEADDYYQYVSYFHRDGIHPTSGGCLIHKDYVHMAVPYEPLTLRVVLAHELTHECVVHLSLPLWINEGLARIVERDVESVPSPMLDRELKDRHLEFWNQDTIQEFWAGVSWGKPGDSFELSYSLAEILLSLILEQGGNWREFLKQADWRDAGQTAAIDCLGADLGTVVSTFLGEGDWRPRRKAMADLWESGKEG